MRRLWEAVLIAYASVTAVALAQPSSRVATLDVEPNALTIEVGQKATLSATARDAAGAIVDDVEVVFFSRGRRNLSVTNQGQVEAFRAGTHTIVAMVPGTPPPAGQPADQARDNERAERNAAIRVEIPVTIVPAPIARVGFANVPARFYAGTTPRLSVTAIDRVGEVRNDVTRGYATSDGQVATVDRFGFLKLLRPGTVEVTARVESVSATLNVIVDASPVSALDLQSSVDMARTGDVVRFTAVPKDMRGLPVRDVPVQFAVHGDPAVTIIAAGAPAQITAAGRFVAERSGVYTVVAVAGAHSATRTIEVAPRDVRRDVELVGRGPVVDRHTSDLWVWEGSDGRDYAITGTWGSDGRAYIWDVTDPTNIKRLHDVQVDARTVNDVKVSEDGTIAVISREGASNRRNGIVILGVGNPREGVPVLAEFNDQLTGGVHNLFIAENHVFALSAGRRYDVINIENPREPRRVGRFELDTPGHGIHDVWVSHGVAFSSNWTDGVVAVDVGGGGKGGSPDRPVKLGEYKYPSGWNHSAFPYRSKSTGKFYVFAGDEAFPYADFNPDEGSTPTRAAGWIHVVEWDDWEAPREVARYQVPEAGTHNLWVEDDVLYVAYYNGGLRVVDVSGELLGDLYRQGREIASFVPFDPKGFIPNAPFVWGPQPYKGRIFLSDWNTGLWVVALKPKKGAAPVIGEPQ